MRAAIFESGQFSVGTLPDPSPAAGQLLVRPIVCGICGSDLSIHKDAPHLCNVLHRAGFRGFMDPAKPVVLGHEFACEVIDVGKGCDKFGKGQRLTALPFLADPSGVQLIGYSNSHNGAFAEAMLIDEAAAFAIPDHVSDDIAAMAEPLAVAVHAIEQAYPTKDSAFAVFGCGPVGLFVIARLKALGLGPILAIEPTAARRALAERMGADVVLEPGTDDVEKWWSDLGLPCGLSDSMATNLTTRKRSHAVLFDCVGKPGILMQIAKVAPVAATIVGIGTCKDDDLIEPAFLLQKGLRLQFVFAYSAEEFDAAFQMICDNPEALAPMISRKIGFNGLGEAFDTLSNGATDVKILVSPAF